MERRDWSETAAAGWGTAQQTEGVISNRGSDLRAEKGRGTAEAFHQCPKFESRESLPFEPVPRANYIHFLLQYSRFWEPLFSLLVGFLLLVLFHKHPSASTGTTHIIRLICLLPRNFSSSFPPGLKYFIYSPEA